MKKLSFAFMIALIVCLFVGLTACNDGIVDNTGDNTNENDQNITDDDNTSGEAGNVLVAYFSRAGENYMVGDLSNGGYAGYVEKGNTAIIAEMIAEGTGGTLFEIVPVVPYPVKYSEMLTVAEQEASTNVRPAIQSTVPKFDSYDVIFLGYPIWNGNCPNIMLTFMECYDFSGKTVIPFCTHGGSRLGSSVNTIRSTLPSATILDGLAIEGVTAQNDRDTARSQVNGFIEKLNLR